MNNNPEEKPNWYGENWPYHRHHGSPIGALILLTLGVLFLLNNFGLLAWDVWHNLWRFWPFLLVMLGLQEIFGRSRVGGFLVFIIGLALVALVVAYAVGGYQLSWPLHW